MSSPHHTLKFDLEAFRAVQRLKGLSASEVARAIGMDPSTVLNFNKGKTSPTVRALLAFCNAYGLDAREFFVQEAKRKSKV